MNNQTPAYISDLLQPNIPTRTLRSSTKQLLTCTTYKNITYGGRAFSHAGPKLWNALPLDIRESTNLETFKRKLKTHMFTRAYSVRGLTTERHRAKLLFWIFALYKLLLID